MNKSLVILILLCSQFTQGQTQNRGYFGKQNYFEFQGTWFLRSMPQIFFRETIYHYSNRNDEFKSGFLKNHTGNIGFSYKRILNERAAIGVQYDFGSRNLGSPIFDLNRRTTFSSPWKDYLNDQIAWSESAQRYLDLKQLEINRTQITNHSTHATYSRSKTSSVFPLGLVNTYGLGVQFSALNTSHPMYASALSKETLDATLSPEKQIFQLNEPINLDNRYLGLSLFWNISIQYAINDKLLFSLGTEIRSIPWVAQISDPTRIKENFALNNEQIPSIEAVVYGRNLSKEIRKEMLIQNTLRFGLILSF